MKRPLLISHVMDHTGAPIALLELARTLQRLGERPLVLPLRDGPLRGAFTEAGIEVVDDVEMEQLSLVIANTVVSVPVALCARGSGAPLVGWIHETLYYFDLLRIPHAEAGLDQLDMVLAPTRFQLEEFAPLAGRARLLQLRYLVRQDHWRPPSGENPGAAPTVAVVGSWEARKGQADLLQLIAAAGVACRLKFIGTARPADLPDAQAAGHAFLGALPPHQAKYEIARSAALLSCAQAEAQPLSVIEAAMAGRPALLSDIAAHRALARQLPNVFLFDRTRPASFAAGWRRLMAALADETAARRGSEHAHALFGEAAFEARLRLVLQAIRSPGAGGVAPFLDE